MAIEQINLGTVVQDGADGDVARVAFTKVNANFADLESRKVEKVAGKQLSTEDYTSAEKMKLAGIESGAQVNTVTSVAGKTGAVALVKGDVGLGNVDNTSDANKPISTATQTALNLKADTSTQIIAGTGLTGGGTLDTNRTLAVSYGTTAGTSTQGNDSRLSDAREWSAETVSQAEAEAGTATTRRAWTAQRVRQAVVAWWNSVSSAWGRGFVASADAAAGRTALELGSAATATVQTSPTDTTAGALMAVGAFGLGALNAPVVTDLNTVKRQGFYAFTNTTANTPVAAGYGTVIHTSRADSEQTQLAYVVNSASVVRIFCRNRYSITPDVWGPWRELFHTGNQLSLGTTPAEAQTALELVKGTSPGNVLVAGSELVGKHTVECFSFQHVDFASGVTIYTNITTSDGFMPSLIIRGTLNGYTSPFEAKLSWYFYDDAVYMPNVLITATGGVSGVRFYLRPENGKIVIRIDFGASFYIPSLAFDALLTTNEFTPLPAMLRGWSAVASNVVGSGEVEAQHARTYHSRNILGTVSQSGGVPTGAIIERGSNANGEYVKFADGTQEVICNMTVDFSNYTSQLSSGVWFAQLSLPATFSSGGLIAGSVSMLQGLYNSYANTFLTRVQVNVDANAVHLYRVDNTDMVDTSVIKEIRVFVRGRWY